MREPPGSAHPDGMKFDDPELHHLLTRVQGGVVSWAQLRDLGAEKHDVDRMLRRRELTRIHRGVFIDHTGRPSRRQLEVAAVLACAPAALGFESALGLPTPDGRIRLVVPYGRTVRPPPGVRIQRSRHFEARVDPMQVPPAIRFTEAAIDAALGRDPADAFTLLAEVIHTRRTTPGQLRNALAARVRVPGRLLLTELLDDLDAGTCSVLERGYLRLVERPHRLPRMNRQVRDVLNGRVIYRDGEFAEYGVVIELDGLAFHNGPRARARDSVRDLETLADTDAISIRISHPQVFQQHCRTAHLIGTILRKRGWPGMPARCPSCL